MNLPETLRAIWAKTDPDQNLSLSLPQHLQDTFDVAGHLWVQFIPNSVKGSIAQALGGEASARSLTTFLAGTHDVGKMSPAFQVQGPENLLAALQSAGFALDMGVKRNRTLLPHGLAGELALEHWLVERHGWKRRQARKLGCIVGGHHGTFPESEQVSRARSLADLLGNDEWHEGRELLLDDMTHKSGAVHHLDDWRKLVIPPSTQVLLTAIVILSDWIASNQDLFPLGFGARPETNRAQSGWTDLELPRPWKPSAEISSPDELLRSRFNLPAAFTARPAQTALLQLAEELDEPGLFILEAPMGIGKTEAALMLAEKLAVRQGLGGVFFALPSRSTSDAIFTRLKGWVENLPGSEDAPTTSMFLAHSKAHLNDEYMSLTRSSNFVGVGQDEESDNPIAVLHEWLTGRKKGVLANFVVGTIDQVLFAALKSKHLVLRHLALAGKVVIIDEVHAADEYMGVYLDRALEWLGAHSVPVILLSATLPGARRKAMLQAYDAGRGHYTPKVPRRGQAPAPTLYDYLETHTGYPLLTASNGTEPLAKVVTATSRESQFEVLPLSDDETELRLLLEDSLSDGGCAVVIRNTVGRAQETYADLKTVFGDDVSLIHSRFIASDRASKEAELLARFGPLDRAERPHRHIVVATQVVEQSLDIDFDVMISDIAPVDLILQRSGRMHRHQRSDRPAKLTAPRFYITGVDWNTAVPELNRGSAAVYGRSALLRSLAVLRADRKPIVRVPSDIPNLVQAAYSTTCPVPNGWESAMAEADEEAEAEAFNRRQRANDYLLAAPRKIENLLDWTKDVTTDLTNEVRGRAAVRDSRESIEVLVVQRREDGEIYRWRADDGEFAIPTDYEPDLNVARLVSADTVLLPPTLTHPGQIDRTIDALEKSFFPGWQASRWLREQLVLVLDRNCRWLMPGFEITYSDETGLTAVRNGDAS